MIRRLVGVGLSKAPTYVVVHVLVLVPLLTLKLVVAHRLKHLYSLLMPLGLAIFTTAFGLVALSLLSRLLRSTNPESAGLRGAFVVVVALCFFLCVLAVRHTAKQGNAAVDSVRMPLGPVASTGPTDLRPSTKPRMTLVLTHIEQQTPDTKSLRFLVLEQKRFRAKPGQFLTFHWSVAGTRVLRSYTISSSPTHNSYVEITPKRVENGCVSTFLHDDAQLGLMVEATGPHGKFYFDETAHRSIVLIAAGSGITPMISMLRYIDDRRLPTPPAIALARRIIAALWPNHVRGIANAR
jgi:predicted ferric reductase